MSKRLKSWLMGIFLFFVLLFISLRLIIFFWLNPILDKVLKQAVSIYSDGLYQVRYDDFRVKPLERKLTIENFILDFDSTRIHKDTSFRENIFVKASAKEIEIAVGSIPDLLFNRYLKVKQVFLTAPQISIYNYADSKNSGSDDPFDAYALVKDYFDSVHIQYVNIKEAGFMINNMTGKPFQSFSLKHINASVINMIIDSSTVYRNLGYPKADQFTLIVQNAQYTLPDSLHEVTVGKAAFHPMINSVVLKEVAFSPKYDKQQFALTLGYRKDWIKGFVSEIKLDGIDLHKLIVDNLVDVKTLSADNLKLEVYRDRSIAKNDKSTRAFLLREALRTLSVPFKLDKVMVKNALVSYEELVPPSEEPGQVFFNRIYASIYHMTNIDSLSHDRRMTADVQAHFMGESLLEARFDFPLDSRNNWHSIRGSLEEIPLESVNKLIEPTAFASIQSGTLHALEFEIEADNQEATGKVMFEYTDLKVALLNKKAPNEDPKLKHKVGSTIANWFVVKTNNPNENQPLREGIIYYPRNEESSMFSYWAQALMSGLRVSVGIDKEPVLVEHMVDDEPQEEKNKKGFLKRLFKKKKRK